MRGLARLALATVDPAADTVAPLPQLASCTTSPRAGPSVAELPATVALESV